jgi:hypothetical protein
MKHFPRAVAVLSIVLALAGCGGGRDGLNVTADSASVSVVTPVQPNLPDLVFLADGTTVHSVTLSATGYTEVGSAAIPAAALAANHQIFNLVVHPNKQWVYAASAVLRNWGNAQISRFSVDWTTGALTYVDAVLMTAAPGPNCATSDECAPVGLGITDGGTRLIVEENSDDTYHTYAIAADGSLSYVTSGALGITDLHGVGINAAGTYVYQGSEAYSRAADVITDLGNGGTLGNSSAVLNIGGTEKLYTTLRLSEVGVLSLADPANPTVISSLNPDPLGGTDSTVSMDVSKDGSRIIAVGDNSVAIVDFDGTTLTVRNQIAVTGRARGVAFNSDASLAVVSFQTGGAKLYSIAADGTLTEVVDMPSPNPTRAVVFSTSP